MADPQITSQIMEVLSDPMNLPPTFWNYSVQRWLADAPVFPISQVFGFTQFLLQDATQIATQESRSSATYGDLATVGPSLTNLPDGKYAVFFGALVNNNAGGSASMSVQVNSTGAVDSDRAFSDVVGSNISVMRYVSKTLANANNSTITCKYQSGGASASFWQTRWLAALKIANN